MAKQPDKGLETRLRTVSQNEARWRCPEDTFSFDTTAQAKGFKGIVAQDRAVQALQDGMRNPHEGYNIFISGSGSGKETMVDKVLKDILKLEEKDSQLEDVLCVHNFEKPDEPKMIYTKAGQGKEFASDMEHLVESILRIITRTTEMDFVYRNDEMQLLKESVAEAQELPLVKEFNEKLKKHGVEYRIQSLEPVSGVEIFTAEKIQEAVDLTKKKGTDASIIPDLEKFKDELDEEDRVKFDAKRDEFRDEWSKKSLLFDGDIKLMEKKLKVEVTPIVEGLYRKVDELRKEYILPNVNALTKSVNEKYDNKAISEFLNSLVEYLGSHLKNFKMIEEKKRQIELLGDFGLLAADPTMTAVARMGPGNMKEAPCFRVNVIVDNSETKGVPIVKVKKATLEDVFGKMNTKTVGGMSATTNHMMIEAGDIHKARGGVLILDAMDLLTVQNLWHELKNALETSEAEINRGVYSILSGSQLDPEPVDCSNTKVIVVGDALSYAIFDQYELLHDDFHKIFKIRAETASILDNTPEQRAEMGEALATIFQEEGFLPFDRSALSVVMEYSVRLAGSQKKLSARIDKIVNIASEANALAQHNNKGTVTREHIEDALERKHYRMSRIEDRIQEMIDEGVLIIDTDGEVVGQVNAVAVLSTGEYSFGIPERITANTYMRAGSINVRSVEKEAGMSGKTHIRSVVAAESYIGKIFGQDKILALQADVTFEQLYSGLDGDSASVVQTLAILSDIAGVPVKQNVVATSSHDLKGRIQPIGGINEKIEGVYKTFETARQKKMDAGEEPGDYHFILPVQNLSELQLHPDVVADLYDKKENEDGWFHLHPVEHISDAVGIFTGMKFADVKKEGDKKLKKWSEIGRGNGPW